MSQRIVCPPIVDPFVEFQMGASGPRIFDTGKVLIGAAYIPPRKSAVTQAERDIQAVFAGRFKPYPGKEKRGLLSRVWTAIKG